MPIPKHFRFVFRGSFVGTPEAWSFGVHFRNQTDGNPDASLDDVDMDTLVSAWVTLAGGANMPTWARLDDVRAYLIGTNGRAVGNVKVKDVAADNHHGGTAQTYPPQVALVATFVALNRGPGKLGRIYLPTAAAMSGDARVSSGLAISIAGSVSAFLKGCSDAVDIPDSITTSSAGVNVSTRGGSDGTIQEIDHVEVGRVLDTMRSRRRSLVEERQADAHIDW